MALATPARPSLPHRLSVSSVSSTPGYFSYTPREGGGSTGGTPRSKGSVRLLWRGAGEFQDGSFLDGMAFVSHLTFPGLSSTSRPSSAGTQTPPTSLALPSSSPDLGISLSLESLRGRGSVKFRGRVDIGGGGSKGGWVEGHGGVRLYVDPTCPALYAYLRRQLLPPSLAIEDALDSSGRSTNGLLVSLGDESIDQAPLIIYALLVGPKEDKNLSLHVGIYHSEPAEPVQAPSLNPPTTLFAQTRPPPGGPRPDDPAPRSNRVPELRDVFERGRKRRSDVSEGEPAGGEMKKRSLSYSTARHSEAAGDDPFSVSRPSSRRGSGMVVKEEKGEERMEGIEDDLGLGEESFSKEESVPYVVTSGGRKKANPHEADNKTTIKRVAMQALAERGVGKSEDRFREIWNMVSRGALFSFRDEVGVKVVPMRDILNVVEGHLDLYLRKP